VSVLVLLIANTALLSLYPEHNFDGRISSQSRQPGSSFIIIFLWLGEK
jgi:hypothetical protein